MSVADRRGTWTTGQHGSHLEGATSLGSDQLSPFRITGPPLPGLVSFPENLEINFIVKVPGYELLETKLKAHKLYVVEHWVDET